MALLGLAPNHGFWCPIPFVWASESLLSLAWSEVFNIEFLGFGIGIAPPRTIPAWNRGLGHRIPFRICYFWVRNRGLQYRIPNLMFGLAIVALGTGFLIRFVGFGFGIGAPGIGFLIRFVILVIGSWLLIYISYGYDI